tara:strand:- start:19909 stop:20748 length:840 start_codon:yes stop_codon:yes gene_type:complete
MKNKKLTVVIPTLGKKNLDQLLKKLIKNNFVKEILISIPYSYNKSTNSFNNKKIKIIRTKFKHQVKQRIICYKKIKTKYTLLLDDDVSFNNNFILKLFKAKIQKGDNTVIGPTYYDYKNFKKIHSFDFNLKNIIKRFFQTIFFGIPFTKKRMGKISKAGTCYGVDPDYMDSDYMEVDWIPGGCMILSTKNLVNKNYFYIKGKAYCEDLIQSYLWKKKKLSLYIYNKTKIYTDSPNKLENKEDLKNYMDGHKLFCKYSKLTNIRVTLWRTYLSIKLIFTN